MSSLYISLIFSIYWKASNSGCIPANTCFATVAGSVVDGVHEDAYDKSILFTCSTAGVKKYTFSGSSTCGGSNDWGTAVVTDGTISEGDKVVGSSSGVINTAYLQGEDCPYLTGKSETCSEFMVLKHRGDVSYEGNYTTRNGPGFGPRPYLDIGDNCTNYIENPPSYSSPGPTTGFSQYNGIVISIGCHHTFIPTQSVDYWCNENGWGYTYYDGTNCAAGGGDVLSTQTESFKVDECGYFSEWTHCNDPQISEGCVDDGVHDYWWYWYDLVCCPIAGRTCSGAAKSPTTSSGGTSTQVTSGVNPSPTTSPASGPSGNPSPTTSPNSSGSTPTTSPASGPSGNTSPTSSPNSSGPSGSTPTASPNSSGPSGSTPTTSPVTKTPTTAIPTSTPPTTTPTDNPSAPILNINNPTSSPTVSPNSSGSTPTTSPVTKTPTTAIPTSTPTTTIPTSTAPTTSPIATDNPSIAPSSPTNNPTSSPTSPTTKNPTSSPTFPPTSSTSYPSNVPTGYPSSNPLFIPVPTTNPSKTPIANIFGNNANKAQYITASCFFIWMCLFCI